MQRRIEQPDRDRQALHDLEQFGEVAALHRQQLGERRAAALLVVGEDHLAHRADAVGIEEHVLGAAEADAFGAELERDARVVRRVGIGAHLQLAHLVGPAHQRARTRRRARAPASRRGPASTWPVEPSMVIDLALLERRCRRRSSSAPHSRRAASPRRRRTACPCRARPPPHARSCRRAWSGCLRRRACRECPPARSRRAPGSPSCPAPSCASASSAENTISPEAAPGEAGRPVAITLRSAFGSMVGCSSWSSAAGSTRVTASSLETTPSLASSTAMRSAALAVRLPERVCSIHSLPFSTVNSRSCMSR